MKVRYFFFIFLLLISFAPGTLGAQGLSVEELQKEIERKRLEKERLLLENKKLEIQIQATNKEAQTLQSAVKVLDTTQKKLQNDLKVTETKINSTELSIQKLGLEITDKEKHIHINKEALAKSLRNIQDIDAETSIETFLKYKNINELWNTIETLRQFQSKVQESTQELKQLQKELSDKKTETQGKKVELVDLKEDLSDQKVVVDQNKKAKSTLLTQTKNKEDEYKKLLARNIELGKKFEQELFQYEAALQIAIDKSKIPTEKSGVLRWPLDNITITQRFGATVDARRLYVSGSHNGIDFRASMGTPVKSVLEGTVTGVGNTDDQTGCYSYGRWVLIKHPNGLSSLYAHLSVARVSPGQSVSSGEVIGLSGGQPGTSGAGYSTGPHLHLGLYATEGVSVAKYSQSKFCKQVSIPISSPSAYLDPLAYLPPLN